MAQTVMIAGAGAGGLTAAMAVRSYLNGADRVVLIDQFDRQHLGFANLLVMRGWRQPDEVTVRPSALRDRGIEFVEARVVGIFPGDRRITTTRGDIPYDALIIALGAELNPDLVPGLADALRGDAAGEFYTLDGAAWLRDRLTALSEGRICLVVSRLPYKCPPAPYEGALLIDDLLRERGARTGVRIDVFTPEPSPIGPAGPHVGATIVQYLADREIGFHPGAEIRHVDPQRRTLTFLSGREEPYDLLVAIPPHQPPDVVVEAGLGSPAWVPIDGQTMGTDAPGIWAIGDVSSLRMANGMPLPKAAVFATAQAEAAARSVARALGHPAPEPAFDGSGKCWFIVGQNQAGYIEGQFLAESGPVVSLHAPSSEHFRAMDAESVAWLDRWATH